jgi:hypothetical protein
MPSWTRKGPFSLLSSFSLPQLKERSSYGSSYKDTNHIHEGSTLIRWPYFLPKTQPLKIFTLGLGFQHINGSPQYLCCDWELPSFLDSATNLSSTTPQFPNPHIWQCSTSYIMTFASAADNLNTRNQTYSVFYTNMKRHGSLLSSVSICQEWANTIILSVVMSYRSFSRRYSFTFYS